MTIRILDKDNLDLDKTNSDQSRHALLLSSHLLLH